MVCRWGRKEGEKEREDDNISLFFISCLLHIFLFSTLLYLLSTFSYYIIISSLHCLSLYSSSLALHFPRFFSTFLISTYPVIYYLFLSSLCPYLSYYIPFSLLHILKTLRKFYSFLFYPLILSFSVSVIVISFLLLPLLHLSYSFLFILSCLVSIIYYIATISLSSVYQMVAIPLLTFFLSLSPPLP